MKFLFSMCPLSMHGVVPPAIMFSWQGLPRAARGIGIFFLTVEVSLIGEVLLILLVVLTTEQFTLVMVLNQIIVLPLTRVFP